MTNILYLSTRVKKKIYLNYSLMLLVKLSRGVSEVGPRAAIFRVQTDGNFVTPSKTRA